MLRETNAIHAEFAQGITVSFLWNGKLTIRTTAERASGEPCEEATLPLTADFSLTVSKDAFLWKLNRLSDRASHVPAMQGKEIIVRQDTRRRVTELSITATLPCAYIWGTGERFDAVNQKGRASNGRVVERFTHQQDQTYLPAPFFITEQGFGWYRGGGIPARMTFGEDLCITQETEGPILTEDHLLFGRPREVLAQYIAMTGRPVLPPDWAFGLWISANGWHHDAEVEAQLQAIKTLDYPALVMVLEAWSDERTFYRWNDRKSWRDPAALVKKIRDAGLHLVLWQIPIIKHEWDGDPGEALRADMQEAVGKGYCVMCADGTPYRITEKWFHNSLLLDFTNPEAVRWWFDKRAYLLEMGVEGFKTDGGEFLFDKRVVLHNGLSGRAAHNLYPAQYVGAYHDFMQAHGVAGVTFSRAGYVGAQTQPMHWAGDQESEWCELEAQLCAGISAGLSGILFWGFDIGGFAGELPSAALYLRATAMGCFSPVMQWHSEPRSGQFYSTQGADFINDRSPWNLAEKLHEPRLLSIARYYARVRVWLMPYLLQEARNCVENLRPMMAHLCIDFADDPTALATEDEYMLGRGLLVAPLVKEGAMERDVYLPKGRWRSLFTQTVVEGNQTIRYPCDLEQIPVFERMGENDGCEEYALGDFPLLAVR
ncbi:MAG: hypothetical protein LBU67_02990 [Oscillospiraceae bacterium]|nr:hypothetical protein [Oscillospiraceae bacterium]